MSELTQGSGESLLRCPFRVAGFDQPPTCDTACAWRITIKADDNGEKWAGCAIALLVIQGDWRKQLVMNAEKVSNG